MNILVHPKATSPVVRKMDSLQFGNRRNRGKGTPGMIWEATVGWLGSVQTGLYKYKVEYIYFLKKS